MVDESTARQTGRLQQRAVHVIVAPRVHADEQRERTGERVLARSQLLPLGPSGRPELLRSQLRAGSRADVTSVRAPSFGLLSLCSGHARRAMLMTKHFIEGHRCMVAAPLSAARLSLRVRIRGLSGPVRLDLRAFREKPANL